MTVVDNKQLCLFILMSANAEAHYHSMKRKLGRLNYRPRSVIKGNKEVENTRYLSSNRILHMLQGWEPLLRSVPRQE
jgi:hypothetical protein